MHLNISSFTKKYALPLFVIAIISNSIEEINFIYYTVPLFLILFIFVGLKDIKFGEIRFGSLIKNYKEISINNTDVGILITLLLLMLTAVVWYISSALWSDYPMVTLQRGFYFGLLSTGCIFGGYLWMKESGKSVFDYLLPANIIIIGLSIFSLISNIPDDSWTGGHGKGFVGFFGHQNLLGSLILFTIPAVFYKLWLPVNSDQLSVNSKGDKVKSLLTTNFLLLTSYYLLLTSNFLILALTYSRASWLSLTAGIIIFLILVKNWKILIISFSLLTFFVFLILVIPTLNKTFNKIILKDFSTVLESRIYLWQPSLKAAKIGGLIGLGYGISEPDILVPGTGSYYEDERYVREKGNSFLALIEETGIIGLLLFILPICYIIIKSNKLQIRFSKHRTSNIERYPVSGIQSTAGGPASSGIRHPVSGIPYIIKYKQLLKNSFIIVVLISFLLHSQFEAWMVGVGSVQLPLFLIFIGIYSTE